MEGKAAFNEAAESTLGDCQAIHSQRGIEYADSWALENQRSALTTATLAEFGVKLTPEQIRVLQAAVLSDIKDSRLIGGFKYDHVVDGVNYRAVWGYWMRKIVESRPFGGGDERGASLAEPRTAC